MIDRRFRISRRTLLRGAGAALGLPWLEAMMPTTALASSATLPAPKRMGVLFMPNGVHPDMWTPTKVGRDFDIPPTLKPLTDLKNDILVLTNLWNANSKSGDGHYVKTSGFLTCTTITKTLGVDINCNGVSMDQLAAQRTAHLTPLPSLELGTAPVTTGVDRNVGYTRVYGSHIAWAGPTSPLAREVDPRLVFERLFRAGQGGADEAKRTKQLLDVVLDDAKRLQKQLGTADRHRVDEYLSVVRSLEQRVDRASRPEERKWQPRVPIDPATQPQTEPASHEERVRLMMDMIALAYQSDSTRICTFMFGNSVSNENFSFLDGVSGSHHSISHHQNDADKMRQYQLINVWHVEQYAYLLRKLRDMKEGEHSVLDNSMVLFGSALRDGNRHWPHDLPLILGGRGGGRIDSGQHLKYSEDSPLADLYVSMLDAFGTPVERFADSRGRLPGVLVS